MAEQIYGIIDLARARTLYPMVRELGGKARCLFAGPLAEELRQVSPHLVNLSGGSRLRQQWRLRGKGRSWGLLLAATSDMRTLHRHLRHFLQARLPDKKQVLFRYYDPRVFRVYLPTCNASELEQWFGRDVGAYYIETPDGSAYWEYRRADGDLRRKTLTDVL